MRRIALLALVVTIALIGMACAQEEYDSIDISGNVPAVLKLNWQNVNGVSWSFSYANWDDCDLIFGEGSLIGDVCYFNDGNQINYTAQIYFESNEDGTPYVIFSTSEADGKLHRNIAEAFTPISDLEIARQNVANTTYQSVELARWDFDSSDTTDCSLDADQGGSCTVPLEFQQGIDVSEVSPGAGRLKQGTYTATVIATVYT